MGDFGPTLYIHKYYVLENAMAEFPFWHSFESKTTSNFAVDFRRLALLCFSHLKKLKLIVFFEYIRNNESVQRDEMKVRNRVGKLIVMSMNELKK